jgi:hypothetical protein
MNFAAVENRGVEFGPSTLIRCRAFLFCHPERAFCAKDLCSWARPLQWTEGMALFLKTSRSQVDRILDPERDNHAVKFAAGGGFGGAASCD